MRVAMAGIRMLPRRREDLGNLDELAESLQRCGLLHAIVVDDQLTLVAEQRRLEAAKRLGWTHIDVKRPNMATASFTSVRR